MEQADGTEHQTYPSDHLAHHSAGYAMGQQQQVTQPYTKRTRERRSLCSGIDLRSWFATVVLAVLALCVSIALAGIPGRHYRVAVLTLGWPHNVALEGFREELARRGYHEGQDISFMVEDVQGEVDTLADRAAKIVEAKPDIIFTIGTAATAAAKQATTTLPIVFTFVADPLRSGIITSNVTSTNNLTGISSYAGPLSGKRLEVFQEVAPGIKRVLVLMTPHESIAEVSFQSLAEVAPKLGIELLRYDVTSKADIEQRLKALPRDAVDAIYYVPSNLVLTHLDLLIHKAKEDKIPLSVSEISMVERGALVSYGTDLRRLGVQAARLVTKIMKGGKPSEMPIQMPEQLFLTVNLATAKSIGLDIPRSILERAERLME
jgi:putative ABC transport system substrate-binding protein